MHVRTAVGIAFLATAPLTANGSEVRAIAHPAAGPPTATSDNYSVTGFAGAPDGPYGPPQTCFNAEGRYLTFVSFSSNLVGGQLNGSPTSVFVADLVGGITQVVSRSVTSPTTTANGVSSTPAISADGRWIAYQSVAANLVAGQVGNGTTKNVILFDRVTGSSLLVSHASGLPLSGGNGDSVAPQISGDGRFVTFLSKATNLLAGETVAHDPSGLDLFLFDRTAGSLTLLSHRAGDPSRTGDGSTYWRVMSADGALVAFVSDASDLVPGQVDSPGSPDVFLFDRVAGTTALLSRQSGTTATAANGTSLNPTMSADGRFVAFTSYATDLFPGMVDDNGMYGDVFLHDRLVGSTVLVSHVYFSPIMTTPDGGAADPRVSADGGSVAYRSFGTYLVPGQLGANDPIPFSDDLFVYDTVSGQNTLVTRSASDPTHTANGNSGFYEISADGSRVVFGSTATDLVASQADTNAQWDVFLYDRYSGRTSLASRVLAAENATGNGPSQDPMLSADGNTVAFNSAATDLVASDGNGTTDAFLFRLVSFGVASSFEPLPPCRLLDTRVSGGLTTLAAGSRRDFALSGLCGVPPDAKSVSVNVAVTGPLAAGFVNVFPAGLAVPPTSAVNFSAGQTRANNLIVSTSGTPAGTVTVHNASAGAADVIVDVNGFFR